MAGYCSEVCQLFELFSSSVKGMASRHRIIWLDWIRALQNFCSVFTSILLSICLHTSSKWVVFILHRDLRITGKSLRVKYNFDIHVVSFSTHTASCTMISTAYIRIVWGNTSSFIFILPSHLQLHIPYFRKKNTTGESLKKGKKPVFTFSGKALAVSYMGFGLIRIFPCFCAMGGCCFSFSITADELSSK